MKRANGFRVAADSLHPAYALVDNIVINRRVLATLALELLMRARTNLKPQGIMYP